MRPTTTLKNCFYLYNQLFHGKFVKFSRISANGFMVFSRVMLLIHPYSSRKTKNVLLVLSFLYL